ncbi:Hypothetical protein GLP15_2801 [Giardia lamblia P15]|uniref:Uncharacterized protein n=1 Tax=Giardia intestinalis (strain P15) TaxID=658858 RepID=E1F456_GIAIA|nr:Hypothetical protein GLP15_2801 [Giardia lamblia P15]
MNASKKTRRPSITRLENASPSLHQQGLLYANYPDLQKNTRVYYSTQLVESPERHSLIELSRRRTAKESHALTLRKRSMTHLFGITANRRNTLQVFDEVNSYTHLKQINQAQAIRLSLASKNRTADSEYAALSAVSQTRLLYTHPKAEAILGMSQTEHAQYNALRTGATIPQGTSEEGVAGSTLITELPPETWESTVDVSDEANGKQDLLNEQEQQLLSTRATVCESDAIMNAELSVRETYSDYLTIEDLAFNHTTTETRKKPRPEQLANLERQRLIAKIESACIPPSVRIASSIGVHEMALKPIQSIPSTLVTSSQVLDRSTRSLKNIQSTTAYVNKLVRSFAETAYLPASGDKEDRIRHSVPSSHRFVTTEASTMKDLIHLIPNNPQDMRKRSRESIVELSGSGGPRVADVLDVLVWSRKSTAT